MKEYIERSAAMESILGLTIADPAVAQYADAVCYHLQNLPTADVVEVRHGRWSSNGIALVCSECGRAFRIVEMFAHYCPWCGSRMDKPLKDWTLGELSDYCKKVVDPDGNCFNCEAKKYIGLCPFEETAPCDWDFEVKPRFTEQEVEDAKTIKRMFPGAMYIERIQESKVLGISGYLDGWIAYIDCSLFPEIKPGQSVTLDEIIGGGR